VYDERPYEKVKLAVYCTRMIEMLLRAQDVESDFEVVVDIAHRFAREIEHSDLNLQTLEQEFMENPIFNLEPMISWIMGRK
jgi:lysine-N-methylase